MANKVNPYYVYLHIHYQTGAVFYVGVSKYKNRSSVTKNRSELWHKLAIGGFKIENYAIGLTEKQAVKIEAELIKKHGKHNQGGSLANIHSGGSGTHRFRGSKTYNSTNKKVALTLYFDKQYILDNGGLNNVSEKIHSLLSSKN